jgi:type I restriction enzyme S subunit
MFEPKLSVYAECLEARYTSASEHVERLTPSLLAKAFRGELVEQDVNDESAERLLERVKAGLEKRK